MTIKRDDAGLLNTRDFSGVKLGYGIAKFINIQRVIADNEDGFSHCPLLFERISAVPCRSSLSHGLKMRVNIRNMKILSARHEGGEDLNVLSICGKCAIIFNLHRLIIERKVKEGFFTKIKWLLAAVLSLMMLLPVCISAEEAYPWQTGLCTEPCHVSDGPDETCLPKLDGPKAVLTPDMPVRVFGEEDGCLFIQYKVSDTCMPFGYVPKDALQVEALALDFTFKSAYTLMVNDRLPVTDDPMGEAEGLEFPIELDVYALFELDDWVYIENYHSGGDERFFVKRENMGYGRRFPLEGYTNEFMHGALIISSDSTYTIDAACDPIVIDGVKWPDAQSLAVLDEDENVIVRVERGEDGYFRSAGDWNSDAIDLEFLMLDENGNELQTVGEAG